MKKLVARFVAAGMDVRKARLLSALVMGAGFTLTALLSLAWVPVVQIGMSQVAPASVASGLQYSTFATMPTFSEVTSFVVTTITDYWVYAVAGAVLSGAIYLGKRLMRLGR